jgi:hypothetical protein
MDEAKIIAHYWISHSEHSQAFRSVRAAVAFLAHGREAHDMAIDRVTLPDGTVILSREDVYGLLDIEHPQREARLDDLDRRYARTGLAPA